MPPAAPRITADVPTIEAEYHWMERHPCRCGGTWQLVQQSLHREDPPLVIDNLRVRCAVCGRDEQFAFRIDTSGMPYRGSIARSALANALDEYRNGYTEVIDAGVATMADAGVWLGGHGCECGGDWRIGPAPAEPVAGGELIATVCSCSNCLQNKAFVFLVADMAAEGTS